MFTENLITQLESSYYGPILNSFINALEELGYSSQILEMLVSDVYYHKQRAFSASSI